MGAMPYETSALVMQATVEPCGQVCRLPEHGGSSKAVARSFWWNLRKRNRTRGVRGEFWSKADTGKGIPDSAFGCGSTLCPPRKL